MFVFVYIIKQHTSEDKEYFSIVEKNFLDEIFSESQLCLIVICEECNIHDK